jgi:histidine triad (HIT) family protein
VRAAVGEDGSTIGINNGAATGQTIPHVHVHIVPRRSDDGAGSVHTIFHPGPRRPVAEVGKEIRKALG